MGPRTSRLHNQATKGEVMIYKTKWKPLSTYESNGTVFLVHGRMRKSGLIVFKTTQVTRFATCSHQQTSLSFDLELKDLIKEGDIF